MKKDIMMFIAIKSDCYIRVSQFFAMILDLLFQALVSGRNHLIFMITSPQHVQFYTHY